jgi:mRNA interferase HigB
MDFVPQRVLWTGYLGPNSRRAHRLVPVTGTRYHASDASDCKTDAKDVLEKCEDAKEPLEAWHHEVVKRGWKTPNEVKQQFRNASILKGGRAVFNIAGNKYRLVVAIDYVRQVVFVKFIGTHAQYDQINAETV